MQRTRIQILSTTNVFYIFIKPYAIILRLIFECTSYLNKFVFRDRMYGSVPVIGLPNASDRVG